MHDDGTVNQRIREFLRRREPIGRQLFQRAAHGGIHLRRHRAAQRGDRTRVLRHQLRDDRLRARAKVRRLAGQHLVGDGAERVDVRAAVDGAVAGGLLGRHVLRRAQREPGLRHSLSPGVRHGERDAEVGDEWLPFVQEDVLRLQVAMDDAVTMRVVERAADGDGEPHRFVHRQLLFTIEPRAERLPLHEGHHVEQQTPCLAGVE